MRGKEFRFKNIRNRSAIISDIFCLNSIILRGNKKIYMVDGFDGHHNVFSIRKVSKNYLFGDLVGHDKEKDIHTIDFHTGTTIGPVKIHSINDLPKIFIYDIKKSSNDV